MTDTRPSGLSRAGRRDTDGRVDGFDTHGRIKCGTVATPDLAASIADYAALGLAVVERGDVPARLASLWRAPAHGGRGYALLHGGGRPGYVRLVEGEVTPPAPMATRGWVAFELTVRDVAALHARVAGSAWRVIGAPRAVGAFTTFIPFQVAGRAGEVLYLNQVLAAGVDGLELPFAIADIDHVFIAVLAAPEREAAVAFHEALGFERGQTYAFPIGVVNDGMRLAHDHKTTLTMTRVGSLPASEVDEFPVGTPERPVAAAFLPGGNAVVSFVVRALPEGADAVDGEGLLYRGRRVACVQGAAGELVELIEMAA